MYGLSCWRRKRHDRGGAVAKQLSETEANPYRGERETHGDVASAAMRIDRDRISEKIRQEFELVPEIGSGWRWYDIPYRFLRWLLSSWRRRIMPWRLRHTLNSALNFFFAFNDYERLKIKGRTDPIDNLIVPADAELTQGGIWVAEFFPPSYYATLLAALRASGWDQRSYMHFAQGTNAEQVTQARRGRGFAWSRLGVIVNPAASYPTFDAKREVLPEEFERIEVTAVQIGTSLTSVVGSFRLSEKGSSSLNAVWKASHEPTLTLRGLRRPHVEDRHFAAIHATQRERQRLHDVARKWLAQRCGGFFANTTDRQPAIDFNLFEQFESTEANDSPERHDALRALGMEGGGLYNYVSPQLQGAVFVQNLGLERSSDPLKNCWGVVGDRDTMAHLNDHPGYGSDPRSVAALTAKADDVIRSFLLYCAVGQYGRQLNEFASSARDSARATHSVFRPRQVERLKRELLTTSLDLPAVARDTGMLWKSDWRFRNGIDVRAVPVEGVPNPPDEFDWIQAIGERHKETFERLLQEDASYRTVLATTSSLGASAASARLGTRALVVAGMSLIVSMVALWLSNGEAGLRQLMHLF